MYPGKWGKAPFIIIFKNPDNLVKAQIFAVIYGKFD